LVKKEKQVSEQGSLKVNQPVTLLKLN